MSRAHRPIPTTARSARGAPCATHPQAAPSRSRTVILSVARAPKNLGLPRALLQPNKPPYPAEMQGENHVREFVTSGGRGIRRAQMVTPASATRHRDPRSSRRTAPLRFVVTTDERQLDRRGDPDSPWLLRRDASVWPPSFEASDTLAREQLRQPSARGSSGSCFSRTACISHSGSAHR